jgi:hypothetical protein
MATIDELMRTVLPIGTRPRAVRVRAMGSGMELVDGAAADWKSVPQCPTDCFGVTATLLERSGAYHYVRPAREPNDQPPGKPKHEDLAANRRIEVDSKRRLALTTMGRAWSLLLPFVRGSQLRSTRLMNARRWLLHTASCGHNALWFDSYWFAHHDKLGDLKALEDLYAKAHKIHANREGRYRSLAEVEKKLAEVGKKIAGIVQPHDTAILAVQEEALDKLWSDIHKHRDHGVFRLNREDGDKNRYRWWAAAVELTIAADEASLKLGLSVGEYFDWFRLHTVLELMPLDSEEKQGENRVVSLAGPDDPGVTTRRKERLEVLRQVTYHFSGLTDPDIACVFPKSRTPPVGCSIRNLTHHLALLPSRGIARASWRRGAEKPLMEHSEFNLLLVPYPFRITGSAFAAAKTTRNVETRAFNVQQEWLGDSVNVINAIETLIQAAEREGKQVHGVVLPELALDYKTYAHLVEYLAHNHSHTEILISGVSERPRFQSDATSLDNSFRRHYRNLSRLRLRDPADKLEHGNYIATTSFISYGDSEVKTYMMTFQSKHHRWKLDRQQIQHYQINLPVTEKDPVTQKDHELQWWENFSTLTRSIEFNTFRGGATLIALACEDLARLEPCQELIRAIGPNLVVTVLMDGPQWMNRWSARYATVLADDPGCSVLTLTSLGLMMRTSRTGSVGRRIVGLWKDDRGETRELEMPSGSHALLLKLIGHRNKELTLDGRGDGKLATSWQLSSALPIMDDELYRDLPEDFIGRRTSSNPKN